MAASRGRVSITIRTPGTAKLVAKYSRRANFLGGDAMREHLRERGRAMVAQYLKNVDSFTPGRVPDLGRRYKKRKEKVYGHVYPILVATGQLMAGMRSRVVKTKSWAIQIIFASDHHSGLTGRELARIHARGEGTQPKRDFTKLPKGWNERWLARLRRKLKAIR